MAAVILGICLGGVNSVAAQRLSLTGWFHVIWNHQTRYVLIDDRGRSTDLVLDEELLRPFGGPLAFNRRRVRIVGEEVSKAAGRVRVLSIELERGGGSHADPERRRE